MTDYDEDTQPAELHIETDAEVAARMKVEQSRWLTNGIEQIPDPNGGPELDHIPTFEELQAQGVLMGDPESGDPMVLLGEGMMPMPENTDMDRLIAAYDLVGRIGGVDFVVGYDDDLPQEYWWFARVESDNGAIKAEVKGATSPDIAAEKLARKLVNGGRCASCGRVSTLWTTTNTRDPHTTINFCVWARTGKRWIRGCVDTHDEGQATTEALAAGNTAMAPEAQR